MSFINHNYKHCFIHNPKTAGRAMEEREYVGGSGHGSFAEMKPDIPDGYFTWAFVRHPADRLVSAYHSLRQSGFEDIGDILAFRDFAEWVHWLADNPKRIEPRTHIRTQYSFLCHNNSLTLDFVGRFENLQHDWKNVMRCLHQEPHELPIVNRSAHYGWRVHCVPEVLEKIEWLYAVDYQWFNYPTEEWK